jgi:hypothetical protein
MALSRCEITRAVALLGSYQTRRRLAHGSQEEGGEEARSQEEDREEEEVVSSPEITPGFTRTSA